MQPQQPSPRPIYTSSWRTCFDHRHELAVTPVSISTSFPRFWDASVMWRAIEELTPRGIFGVIKDPAEYERRYLARLDGFGPERIVARVQEVEATTDKPLALCCYEADPAGCHRTMFRRWMLARTGLLIEEWAPDPLPTDQMMIDFGATA